MGFWKERRVKNEQVARKLRILKGINSLGKMHKIPPVGQGRSRDSQPGLVRILHFTIFTPVQGQFPFVSIHVN